ncbi:MAG: SMC-Scp complex subunit ScpB [Acidobacteria bacterium]|nr:SMC-Scp complex subunit ScpB [Acidobacteriota bacterium]
MEITEMLAVMEAIIYVADEPVKPEQLQEVFPGETKESLERALRTTAEAFNERPGGMAIREVAGGFRMTTRPEYHEQIREYLKTRPNAKLSMASLETLAVVAYKQPVTLAEILAIRGKKSSSALHTLLEKNLVAIVGRKQVVGRPILYGTSREFLIHFGLNSLKDLPTLEEFAQLASEQL